MSKRLGIGLAFAGLFFLGFPVAYAGAMLAAGPGLEHPSMGVAVQTSGYLCSLVGAVGALVVFVASLVSEFREGT